MKKILLSPDEAAGNGSTETTQPAEQKPAPATVPAAEPKAEPPVTAKIVRDGKTERELLLERQNARLVKTARKISDEKIELEKSSAFTVRENQKLREQAAAAKQKFSWMGFTS
jgi:hypothetical protein